MGLRGRESVMRTPNQQLSDLAAGRELSSIVPRPSTPQGGRRRYVVSMPLVRIQTFSEGFDYSQTAMFQVSNPSVRLQLKVAVLYKPDIGPGSVIPQSGTGGVYLDLQALDRDEDGKLLPSNQIVAGLPCPTSYEATTMNDAWFGTVHLPRDVDGFSNINAGFLEAVAAWEPVPGWNGDAGQLREIFDACHLYIAQGQLIAA